MIQQDGRKLLNKMNLKFSNNNLEKEYIEATLENNRYHNIFVSLISSILSFTIAILFIFSYILVKREVDKNNLLIERVENKTLLDLIKNNQTSITSGYLFKGKYLLTNGTMLNQGYSKENSLISNSSEDMMSILTSMIFLNVGVVFTITMLLFYIICLIFSFLSYKDKVHKIIFCSCKFLFSQNFHILSGALIVYFKVQPEAIYFLIALQLVFIVIILNRFNTYWLLFLTCTIVSNVLEWFIYSSIVSLGNNVLLYYLVTNSLVHFACVILSYLKEKKVRNEFYLQTIYNKERKYAVDLLYKMDQGFITYNKNKNILFFNNSMKNIINSFKDLDSNFDDKISDLLYIDHRNMSNEYQRVPVTTVNDFNIPLNKKHQKWEPSGEYNIKNPFLLKSNVKPESKCLIDKLFKNLKNVNTNLPDEVLLCFNGGVENLLDLIYEKVKDDESFTSFTYLGVVSFKGESFRENKNFSNSSINDSKYQIMFRIVSHDSEENYLEIMFQDVSEVVQVEREKAVLNTRSLYLSKIAHEFRNPISAIMELCSNIIELSRDGKETTSDSIVNKASYIDDICKVMTQFLKDYSMFTNLKFPCEKNCQLKKINPNSRNENRDNTGSIKSSQVSSSLSNLDKNLVLIKNCSNCGSVAPNYCKKCNVCKNCESSSESLFEYQELIKSLNENFRKLNRSERGENSKNAFNEYFLNLCYENEQENISERNFLKDRFSARNYSVVKANKELLVSALYNLIFHCYRASVNTRGDTNVFVTSNQNTNLDNEEIITTKFSITNTNVQIDSSFLHFLLNEKNKNFDKLGKTHNFQNSDSDKFNKYFELYVAYYFIKKLGSELSIDTGKDGITFSFNIVTKKSDLEELIPYEEEKECLDLDDTGRTVILSSSQKCLQKPSNIQFKKSSDKSLKSNTTNIHPQIIIKEDINLEVISNSDDKDIKVLIIDDEPLIRRTLKKHFKNISKSHDKNFSFEEASNCFEAINTLYKNFLENIHFDLIVIDEFMPNMKGSTFIRLFKQLYMESNFYNLKIISYTAFDSSEKKKLILDSGADYILNKPVSFSQFKELILDMI
jgi:CheY-like chemotaxis protein/signal transduction histidine kinase